MRDFTTDEVATVLGPGNYVTFGHLAIYPDHVAVTDQFGRELVAIYPGMREIDAADLAEAHVLDATAENVPFAGEVC